MINIKNLRPVKFRLGKCWQGKNNSVVFQSSMVGNAHEMLPKKFYLTIDCEQASRGISFSKSRTSAIKPSGVISALIRKYIPSGSFEQILKRIDDGGLWIPIYQGGELTWCLILNSEKPPQLQLISKNKEDFFRFSQKGTYTKKKESPIEFNIFNDTDLFEDILPQIIDQFLVKGIQQGLPDKKSEDSKECEVIDSSEHPQNKTSSIQKNARLKLARRLKTIKKSLEKHSASLPTKEEIDKLEIKANLLQSYAYLIKKNQVLLGLPETLTGFDEHISIDIDPDMSAGKNVENYFKILKKRKKSLNLGQEMLAKYHHENSEMEKDLLLLRSKILTDEEILTMLSKHKLDLGKVTAKSDYKNPNPQPSKSYKIFKGLDKSFYYVGKSPSENDILTKSAKSNDFWFHAVQGGGAHIIVPSKNLSKGAITDDIKREVAILALHFSKSKNNLNGEVYFTQRRHLTKPKGMPVGLWLVNKSKTLYISYTQSEVQAILGRKI